MQYNPFDYNQDESQCIEEEENEEGEIIFSTAFAMLNERFDNPIPEIYY